MSEASTPKVEEDQRDPLGPVDLVTDLLDDLDDEFEAEYKSGAYVGSRSQYQGVRLPQRLRSHGWELVRTSDLNALVGLTKKLAERDATIHALRYHSTEYEQGVADERARTEAVLRSMMCNEPHASGYDGCDAVRQALGALSSDVASMVRSPMPFPDTYGGDITREEAKTIRRYMDEGRTYPVLLPRLAPVRWLSETLSTATWRFEYVTMAMNPGEGLGMGSWPVFLCRERRAWVAGPLEMRDAAARVETETPC